MNDDFLQKLREDAQRDLEKYKKIYEEAYSPLQKVMESVRKTFDSPAFWEAQRKLEEFRERVKEIQENAPKLYAELREQGWFVAPTLLDLPVTEFHALEEKKGEEIGVYFCSILKRDDYALLNTMQETWQSFPEYQTRKEIIDAAIGAHKDQKYELSVAALCLLIEGVLSDVIGVSELNPQNHIKKHLTKKLGPKLNSYELLTREEELFSDLLVKELFGGNEKWSRNSIAHNYLPQHANEENSVRLLFLLDKILKDWGEDLHTFDQS